MTATIEQMSEAFTEWDRRYREDPEAFENEAKRLLQGSPKTYGDACGPYFNKILKEIQSKT